MKHILAPFVAGLMALVLPAGFAAAQSDFPNKQIEMIVPYNPGSTPDIIARLVGPKLSDALGQPVVVTNRLGAGSTIGTRALLNSDPDGHTFGPVGNPQTIHHLVTKEPFYHFAEDTTALTNAASGFYVLVVNPEKQNVTSVQELIDFGKTNPGKIKFGSGGVATSPHLVGEWFKSLAELDMVHVLFSGTETQTIALLRGDIDMAFTSATYVAEHVKSGKLRALAVTLPEKDKVFFPELPTMKESGVDLVYEYWIGFVGPKGIPQPIVERLNAELVKILKDPKVVDILAKSGLAAVGDSAAAFKETIDHETEVMTEVIKAANLQAK